MLPTLQDYNEAIQNPRANLLDPELRAGRPRLTPLGLPRAVTGNFASVYELVSGSRRLAVRCFFRQFAGMRDRYSAIAAALHPAKSPYIVPFTYLDEGIRVRGRAYPVLKMDWLEGMLLDEYLRRHLRDGTALKKLACEWLAMSEWMTDAGLAHGDLQHGNVMIVGDRIRLVDYDGMYVPGMAGRRALELGHPNYQHPRRDERDFSPTTAFFSQWVIYTCMVALAADPDLWNRLRAGDECLLFRRADFVDPDRSAAFATLLSHPEAHVRRLTLDLRSFLELEPAKIPPLDPQMAPRRVPGIRRFLGKPIRRVVPQEPPSSALPEWLGGYIEGGVSRSGAEVRFSLSRAPLRLLFLAPLPTVLVENLPPLAAVPLEPRILTVVGVSAFALCPVVLSYWFDPWVRGKRRLSLERVRLAARLSRLETRIDKVQARRVALEGRHSRWMAGARRRLDEIEQRRRRRRESIEQAIDEQQRLLEELNQALVEMERSEIARAISRRQQRHTRSALRAQKLLRAHIPGVSWSWKARLWAAGIRTAWDIETAGLMHIARLPKTQARSILSWESLVVGAARRTMPTELQAGRSKRILARWRRRREAAARLRDAVEVDARKPLSACSQMYSFRQVRVQRSMDRRAARASLEATRFHAELGSLRSRRRTLTHELDRLELELAAYEGCRFGRYLAFVVLGGEDSGKVATGTRRPGS